MTITLIAAVAENRVIGRDGVIPWNLPEDRKRFRMMTMGHPLIMGRRTFQSLPRPLDGRTIIVLSRNRHFTATDGNTATSLEEALALAADADGNDEVFIAGGGELYRQALAYADRLYLTVIHREIPGDVTFPELPVNMFVEAQREELPGELPSTFIRMERITDYCRGAPCGRP